MIKLISTAFCLLLISYSFSQQNVLLFKKKNKTLKEFWTGSVISFQPRDKEWQHGEITRTQNDSFYIYPMIIRYYFMGSDTLRLNETGFSFSDVYSIPKKGVLIHYANGHFEINKSAGHQHFYWIKSGWLFRIGAAGYAALHVINGLIKHNLSISESAKPLGIAAAVFAGGYALKKTYKLTYRNGKKYHFEILKLSSAG